MHVLSMLMAALAQATLINGSPILVLGDNEQKKGSIDPVKIVEHVRVERELQLRARDIEEADQHGVDLNKSESTRYKTYMEID
jgi:hypothetical protein